MAVLTDAGREALKKRMARDGLTYRSLASIAGYKTHAHVGELLRGTKSGLDDAAAEKIAAHLGLQFPGRFFRLSESSAAAPSANRQKAA